MSFSGRGEPDGIHPKFPLALDLLSPHGSLCRISIKPFVLKHVVSYFFSFVAMEEAELQSAG